jgi:tRNA 5-methylaminomethyl-2-thiouridine biosynthesis bifunctional protein
LYVATALGSRGITWAPLVGEVIASWITGQPPPLPTALLEALDPRRFRVKRARVEARVSAASPPLSEPR